METKDLFFDVPAELVAQTPAERRGESKLFVYDRQDKTHRHSSVRALADHLEPGSILVFNDSRVRKARVFAQAIDRESGRQEFLLLRRVTPNRWLAVGRGTKKLRPGRRFLFEADVEGEIVAIREPYREIEFSEPVDDTWLDRYGHVPLPPYIDRPDSSSDDERYQTVYARSTGSVAAPTAGLHFTDEILSGITDAGIEICRLTLHVGIGTFFPIRTSTVEDHEMHSEEFYISPATADRIERAKSEGRRVVAIGTTSVRSLESAWNGSVLRRGHQSTNLYIYPGYSYGIVDSIFTNFHTPGSTLIAMISAFTGRETLLNCYREAIRNKYRFFSYGDAMLIR